MSVPRHGRRRLESDTLTVDVDPDRGGRIASIRHRASGAELLLRTPWADEDLTGSSPLSDSGDEWHRRYPGGWHGLVPHAGTGRSVDGIEQPFHGEAAWRAWRIIEPAPPGAPAAGGSEASELALGLVLRTVPIDAVRRIALVDGTVTIRQTLRNRSDRAVAITYTEHPAFGPDVLGPGTVVTLGDDSAPVLQTSPDDPGPAFRTVRVPSGSARLTVRSPAISIDLRWDPRLLPYAHLWHELGAHSGFPWWGSVRTLAVEPASRLDDVEPDDPLGPIVIAPDAEVTATTTLAVAPADPRL